MEKIVLSSPGIASILAFRSSAAKVFHMLPDDTDDMSEVVEKVAKKIKAEIENIETQLHTLNDVLSGVSQNPYLLS